MVSKQFGRCLKSIELDTQPYSQDIAEHNTDPTAQTSAFITQLMESSQSDHYRETVKKSLNYDT